MLDGHVLDLRDADVVYLCSACDRPLGTGVFVRCGDCADSLVLV